MHCTNCGAFVEGKFCTACGAASALNLDATPFGQMVTPPRQKGMPRGIKILLVIILSLGTFGTSALTVVQNPAAAEYAVAVASYEKKATDAISSASELKTLLTEAEASKSRCFIDPWCSSSTYSSWIDIVNLDQDLYQAAIDEAASWSSKKRGAIKAQQGAETTRNLLIGTSVLEALGLVTLLVLTRRKKA